MRARIARFAVYTVSIACMLGVLPDLAQHGDVLGFEEGDSAPFALRWVGFVVVALFAQLVGHTQFLKAIMGDDFVRDYKRVIEETGEVFGYWVILLGSIETSLWARAAEREAREPARAEALPAAAAMPRRIAGRPR